MNVNILTSENNSHIQRIKSAISLINSCQKYFFLRLEYDERLVKNDKLISPENFCKQFENINNEYQILIVENLFDDNWFSHEYRSLAIITIGDWEQNFAPPSLRSYIIYQIAQALIHFSADLSEEMALNMVHEPPQGCIYDMTINKPDIKLGMVEGTVITCR